MVRPRIISPTLVRSTDSITNSMIVSKSKKRIKRVEKTRTMDVFIKNAFGIKNRSIYIAKII